MELTSLANRFRRSGGSFPENFFMTLLTWGDSYSTGQLADITIHEKETAKENETK